MNSNIIYTSSLITAVCLFASCLTAQQKHSDKPKQIEQTNRVGLAAYPVYQFVGNVHDSKGTRCWANVEIRTNTSLIHGVTTEFETGNYNFSIPKQEVIKATLIRVSSLGYDTIVQNLDTSQLTDSVIVYDFTMKLSPTDYTIIQGHRPGMLNQPPPDTVWLDNNGNPLPEKEKKQ